MFAAPAEALLAACPLALMCAMVVAVDRARQRRRRDALNAALHELRRPLQALALDGRRGTGRDQLAQAIAALAQVDRAVNGAGEAPRAELVEGRVLAAEAVGRWRAPAASAGRSIELGWHAERARLVCDETAVSRALDNLIANALEHGAGPIRLDGTLRGGRLRLTVADGADAGQVAVARPRERPPRVAHRHQAGVRRGRGLGIVAQVAAEHGGRFAACAHPRGASAVLELPVASPR